MKDSRNLSKREIPRLWVNPGSTVSITWNADLFLLFCLICVFLWVDFGIFRYLCMFWVVLKGTWCISSKNSFRRIKSSVSAWPGFLKKVEIDKIELWKCRCLKMTPDVSRRFKPFVVLWRLKMTLDVWRWLQTLEDDSRPLNMALDQTFDEDHRRLKMTPDVWRCKYKKGQLPEPKLQERCIEPDSDKNVRVQTLTFNYFFCHHFIFLQHLFIPNHLVRVGM